MNNKILNLSQIALAATEKYAKKRFLFDALESELNNKSILILSGPRGVGKTILLKQLIFKKKNAFYLSLDQVEASESLFELASVLEKKYKIKYLILDEIHYNQNYAADLKAIYDFLNLKVLVTSSIALKLVELSHDLSRRAKFFHLYPFSFREFIYFDQNKLLKPLTFLEMINRKWKSDHLTYSHLFKEYLRGRNYPFTIDETDYHHTFKQILQKTLKVDLPQIGKLSPMEILNIEKMLAHIARSGSEGVSFNSISKNVGLSKYLVERYTELLASAYLVQVLFPKGANVLKMPKILLTIPYREFYSSYEESLGAIREDFCIGSLMAMGMVDIHYLKSTRGEKIPDFLVTDNKGHEVVVEVGGKGKGRSQFKGITVEKKYVFVDSFDWKENQIPLFILGMY